MRAVVAGTRWAAPRLTPDKDTFVSTCLPSYQPRPHSGSTVRLLTSSLITPRCTAAPRPCLNHWRYGLWGFWKTCSSYTTGFQFSYFEIYNFVFTAYFIFSNNEYFEAPVYPPDSTQVTIRAQQRCCRLCDGTPALTSWVSLFAEMLKTDSWMFPDILISRYSGKGYV